MMDNCCAPQWADFTCSPQVPSDNYFEIEHEVHEPQIHLKSNFESDLSLPSKAENMQKSTVVEINFDDSLEPLQNARSNVAYFIPHNNGKQSIIETNNDSSLRKAMTNLKLDEESHKGHYTWNISINELKSSELKASEIPNKPKAAAKTKRSMWQAKNIILGKSLQNNPIINDILKNNDSSIKNKNELVAKSRADYCSEYMKADSPSEKRLSFKIISVHQRQTETFKKRRSLTKSQPKVLTCQYRRRSLVKYRRCSNQFISMAEAISKFQNGTPQRFRTISNKDLKPGPLMKLKRSPLKLTNPISPALRCKQRTRQTTVLSQQEREILELEEMRKHQIKAKPVPVNILKAPPILKKVAKKPNTVTEEFHLTQPKKTRHTIGPRVNSPEIVDNKEQNHQNATSITRSVSTSNIPNKKDDKCIEHSAENEKSVKNVVSINFEMRNKEFQLKKEEKLKNLQVQETNKVKAEFHARPVPKFSKPANPIKEQNTKKRTVTTCPFSFAERDKNLAKKKQELVKQMQVQNKKVHVFHANPAPTFKPVTVHRLSRENLQSKEKITTNSKNLPMKQTKSCNDQENKQPNIISTIHAKKQKGKEHKVDEQQFKNAANGKDEKIKLEQNLKKIVKSKFELNTDKRAKERSEFDEKIRKKEQEQEAKRLEEEKNRIEKERLERAELRKLAEVKARPMPVYKPMIILKSSKPPTSPHSPACASKNRLKSVS